ncbi:hypothetical protein MKX01_039458 [Papaver californicum]|nr:hypothetical protein MKX01_039458 [Papaver californicum]
MATAGVIPDQKQIQKQVGCMTGFLQLFDRQHIVTGKRLCSSTKRLSSTTSSSVDSSPQSEKSSIESPAFSKELQQSQPEMKKSTPELCSPAQEFSVPVEIPVKIISSSPSPSPLPALDPKESLRTPWKLREGPRLSLDSRATFDTKGSLYPKEIKSNGAIFSSTSRCESFESNNENENNQKRGGGSPSVIARLMGLEGLPDSSGREPIKKVELTRSASESRVSKDFQYRFIEPKHSEFSNSISKDNVVVTEDYRLKLLRTTADSVGKPKFEEQKVSNANGFCTGLSWNNNHNSNQNQHQMQQRKMFYDAQDFFPEPKQNGTTLYGEIEKRLKMRGIDEPEKDLETLKQILEALQLKGLLHSSSNRKQPVERIGNRNFVFDRRFSSTEESPIVIMKPSRSSSSQFNSRNGRTGQESTPSPTSNIRSRANGINRNLNVSTDSGRIMNRQENELQQRNSNGINNRKGRNSMSSSPDRNGSPARSPSSLARIKPLSIETSRRGNNHNEDQNRRSSPINSPRVSPRRGSGSDQFTSRSPRNNRKSDSSPRERISVRVIDDDSSAFSESSISTSSQFDFSERSKMEEYKDGRTLLERCDKLLHSIAEITSTETELQPSPVSVLDSSFYKDESSPSPIMRRARCIDFKDQSVNLEEDMLSGPVISPTRMKWEENIQSDDSDYTYISEILWVSECLSEDTDVFLLLEKQKYKTSCQVSRVHRKLVHDTITEILDQKRQLLPWKTVSSTRKPSVRQIWMEFRRIREKETTEDLFEIICGALKKDMVGDSIQGWVDCPLETSEAVLDIERLIFKDLIADMIKDLADSTGNNLLVPTLRRTLVF